MRSLPFIGYRIWRANSETLTLTSLSEHTAWPVGRSLTANRPPSAGRSGLGGYGFHALYDFFHSDPYQVRYSESFALWYRMERIHRRVSGESNVHWVVGAIVAWGEVALHEHGFRAEHCRLIALHYQPGERDFIRAKAHPDMNPWRPPTRLQMLADHYRVPLAESPSKLDSYATEWGRRVGPELLAA